MRAHVVGGFVRDMILGKRNLDVDVVIEGDGVAFADAVAPALGARVRAHRRFGTAVLILPDGRHIDVASARTEYYARPGALPTVERSSLRQDLQRRDFSVNAMAACIDPECFGAIADPFGGLKDLASERVRVLHTLSFVEDPTRVFRAVRFESRYRFRMDPTTEDLARSAVEMGLLEEVSGARLREELLAILAEEPASRAIERLADLGALCAVAPSGVAEGDALSAFKATEGAIAPVSKALGRKLDRQLVLAAPLATGASRAATERWLRRMRLGKRVAAVLLPLAEHGPAVARSLGDRRGMRDSRLYGLLKGMPAEALPYLYGTGGPTARERVVHYAHELAHVRAAVTGDDLLSLGYEPSAHFSDVLRSALADRLDGRAVGRQAELANLERLAAKAKLPKGPGRPRERGAKPKASSKGWPGPSRAAAPGKRPTRRDAGRP